MYQVPTTIWNEIAEVGPIRNPSIGRLMAMSSEELESALDMRAEALAEAGHSHSVISAYLALAPLLAEHEAISRWARDTGNLLLRMNALPELLSIDETLSVAELDYELSADELNDLAAMFRRLVTEPVDSGEETSNERVKREEYAALKKQLLVKLSGFRGEFWSD